MVAPIGDLLGAREVIATRMQVADGCYTGEMDFWAYGESKAIRVRELALARGYRLADCYAYSDSVTDLPMLEAVGHPRVVNPDRALRRIARERHLARARVPGLLRATACERANQSRSRIGYAGGFPSQLIRRRKKEVTGRNVRTDTSNPVYPRATSRGRRAGPAPQGGLSRQRRCTLGNSGLTCQATAPRPGAPFARPPASVSGAPPASAADVPETWARSLSNHSEPGRRSRVRSPQPGPPAIIVVIQANLVTNQARS